MATRKTPAKRASIPLAEARGRGRPTVYREEMVDEMLEYFSQPLTREVKTIGPNGHEITERVSNPFPTLARFAANLGITRETLHEWATSVDENGDLIRPQFSYAYKKAKDLQEANLVEGAMSGVHHPAFSIFTAKNVMGWKDKTENVVSGPGGGPVAVSIEVKFVSPNRTT